MKRFFAVFGLIFAIMFFASSIQAEDFTDFELNQKLIKVLKMMHNANLQQAHATDVGVEVKISMLDPESYQIRIDCNLHGMQFAYIATVHCIAIDLSKEAGLVHVSKLKLEEIEHGKIVRAHFFKPDFEKKSWFFGLFKKTKSLDYGEREGRTRMTNFLKSFEYMIHFTIESTIAQNG